METTNIIAQPLETVTANGQKLRPWGDAELKELSSHKHSDKRALALFLYRTRGLQAVRAHQSQPIAVYVRLRAIAFRWALHVASMRMRRYANDATRRLKALKDVCGTCQRARTSRRINAHHSTHQTASNQQDSSDDGDSHIAPSTETHSTPNSTTKVIRISLQDLRHRQPLATPCPCFSGQQRKVEYAAQVRACMSLAQERNYD